MKKNEIQACRFVDSSQFPLRMLVMLYSALLRKKYRAYRTLARHLCAFWREHLIFYNREIVRHLNVRFENVFSLEKGDGGSVR